MPIAELRSRSPFTTVTYNCLTTWLGRVVACLSRKDVLFALGSLISLITIARFFKSRRESLSTPPLFPKEIWIEIFSYLSRQDVNSAGLANKCLCLVSKDNNLWKPFVERRFPDFYRDYLLTDDPKLDPYGFYKLYKRFTKTQHNIMSGNYTQMSLNRINRRLFQLNICYVYQTSIYIVHYDVLSDDDKSTIEVWDLLNKKLIHTADIKSSRPLWITIHENHLYLSSLKGSIDIFDPLTGELLASPKRFGTYDVGKSLCYCIGGNLLYSGSSTGLIMILDLATQEYIDVLQEHTGAIFFLHIKNERLYSYSYDNKVKVWNLINRKCVHTMEKTLIDRPDGRLPTTIDGKIHGDYLYLLTARVLSPHSKIQVLNYRTQETVKVLEHPQKSQGFAWRAMQIYNEHLYAHAYSYSDSDGSSCLVWDLNDLNCSKTPESTISESIMYGPCCFYLDSLDFTIYDFSPPSKTRWQVFKKWLKPKIPLMQ